VFPERAECTPAGLQELLARESRAFPERAEYSRVARIIQRFDARLV
jgi:hypothetical protein